MKKLIKWICISGGLLFLIIIGVLVALPFFIDINTYKPEMEQKVTDITGRACSIGDELSLSFFPWAGVTVSNVSLGNPAGFAEKEFVNIGIFEIRMKLLPLLFKDIQVKRILIQEPDIYLIKGEKNNWDFDTKSASAETKPKDADQKGGDIPGLKNLDIQEVSIINGNLIYKDLLENSETKISDLNLSVFDISFDKPLRIDFKTFINGQPISLAGTIGPIGSDFQEGNISFDLKLSALDKLHAVLQGKSTGKPRLDLMVQVEAFSLRDVFSALNMDFPVETSDPDTFEKLSLDLKLQADLADLRITDGNFMLDDTKTAFNMGLKHSGHPDLKLDVSVDTINVDRYLPPPVEEENQSDSTESSPEKKETDYSALRSFNSGIQAKIGNMTVSNVIFSDFKLNMTSVKGLFNLKNLSLQTYDGSASSSGIFDFRKNTPVMSLKLAGQGIQAGPLLKDAIDNDIIEGTMKTNMAMKFIGDSPDQIKKTLNGKGNFFFNDGAVNGFDLSGMARNLKSSLGMEKQEGKRPRTDFSELGIPFYIKNGLTTIRKGYMSSPFIRLNTNGTANLVNEKLNMKIHPKFVGTIKGQGDDKKRSGVLVPVIIKGTFSEPEFTPDLVGMLQTDSLGNILKSGDAQKLTESIDINENERKNLRIM